MEIALAPKFERKIRFEPVTGGNKTNGTFIIIDEDHTLGNALRWMLNKNPSVKFCAYSIPHPAENKLNLRLETDGSESASEALRKALKDLCTVSDHITQTFEDSVDTYKKKNSI